ncbi:Tad domain-containing protein [Neobacillus sp. 19]|uniref:Tad domain-containing protein n=1 Tax=Neobacillus sp. 19 TaxID=3394458 RepID=UPI003BF6B553
MFKNLMINENGQSLILVAFSIIALIGIAGLAIDGGRLYLTKSQLQKSVDAGALAGADYLLDIMKQRQLSEKDPAFTDSKTQAKLITEQNHEIKSENGHYEYSAKNAGANYVSVYGEENVNLTLMPVLGLNNTKVSAFARVKIGDIKRQGIGQVIPIGIHLTEKVVAGKVTYEKLEFGKELSITSSPGSGVKGDFGFLNFGPLDNPPKNGNGSPLLADYIRNSSPAPLTAGMSVNTLPGDNVKANKVLEAFDYLNTTNKLVYVPIVTAFGGTSVTIKGFALFELVGFDPGTHTITAKFISLEQPGEIGDSAEYGSYDSKLIE